MDILNFAIQNPTATLNILAAIAILFHCIHFLINRRSKDFGLSSVGYKIVALGSFAVAIGPLYGYRIAEPSETLINVGLVLVFLATYRKGKTKEDLEL